MALLATTSPPHEGEGKVGRQTAEGSVAISEMRETVEVAARDIAAELKRRGIGSDEKVTLITDPAREIIPGRRVSRARVVVAG